MLRRLDAESHVSRDVQECVARHKWKPGFPRFREGIGKVACDYRVINAGKIKVTGNKGDAKLYQHYSGYQSG